ncbi:hypothetical protein [[Leptolyngbya] sp. PCC 7376]|uniref:hypothetical protein n=1 Tax=[Leptolyngbya] sp. PCC 7376 TaxID=111781 RepID=UPI0002FF29BF|nr:hypothetical protein [[Leptolyngbya] sp. PCC 7376]
MKFPVALQWLIVPMGLGIGMPVAAQPITPANNSDTTVTQSGTQFDIGGGMLSGKTTNLFHDFGRFGLDQGHNAIC